MARRHPLARWALVLGSLLLPSLAASQALPSVVLGLDEAEDIALSRDPGTARFSAIAAAGRDRAVADGQLPDPELKLGLNAVPMDSLALDREPMTQVVVGVKQSFPPGQTLRFQSERGEAQADADEARARDRALAVQRRVREAYLDACYQVQAAALIEESGDLYRRLIEVSAAEYRAGREDQQSVLGAELNLSLLEDRLAQIRLDEEVARSELGRWIGAENAARPLPAGFPELPALRPRSELEAELPQHPRVHALDADARASRAQISIAREKYKPGWNLDLLYGFRQGQEPDGRDRPDLFSAMVSVDLPLFPDKRQDRQLSASQLQAAAARYARADEVLELERQLEQEYARWLSAGERLSLYEKEILPRARLTAQTSLSSYQSAVTGFTEMTRARIEELNLQLDALRLRLARAKAQVTLLYLTAPAK